MNTLNKASLMLCLAAAVILAACGGGSGSSDAGTVAPASADGVDYVPAAASEGTATFAGWLKQMSGESLDNKDSMNTSTYTPTVQDDAEPVAAPR